MAVLAATAVSPKLPVGNRFMQTFEVAIANAAAANEWIAPPGFSSIEAVVGAMAIGTAGLATTINCILNANGTGVTAGTNPGSLGIESAAGATVHVTIIGKP